MGADSRRTPSLRERIRARLPRRACLGFLAPVVLAIVANLLIAAGPLQAREPLETEVDASGLPLVDLDALPAQVRETLRLVRSGGPFPYRKDGTVFGNRERLLPRRPRGHYTEYTVPTPRSRDRGARRLVVAGEPTRSNEIYYTDDHYRSFRRIREPG